MPEHDVQTWILAWFAARDTPAKGPDVDYFAAGLIDSMGVVELVSDLERQFGFRFANEQFQDRRFATIAGLSQMVQALRPVGA